MYHKLEPYCEIIAASVSTREQLSSCSTLSAQMSGLTRISKHDTRVKCTDEFNIMEEDKKGDAVDVWTYHIMKA